MAQSPSEVVFTIHNLGPRWTPAASYFRRTNPPDETESSGQEQSPDSDLLKSIKRVIRPARPRHTRHSRLYPCHDSLSDENMGLGQELSWNNNCVILSTGGVILRKWTLEKEGQDIQWACRGYFLEQGGVVEGPTGSFSSIHPNEGRLFASPSQTTFSRFAQSAQARQRAMEPPNCRLAVYVFLRNLGKIYVEGGGDYTFHIPFLVRCAWPLRPHGVLIQREEGETEIRDAAKARVPMLPTLFSMHDPFAEPKVVGIASKIHAGLGSTGPTAITPLDPSSPSEFSLPDDFPGASPPPSMSGNPPPFQKPPPTDRVLWVSEEITSYCLMENLVVTCTLPLNYYQPPISAHPAPSTHPSQPSGPNSNASATPGHHRWANQMHLTVWRYAYFKQREVPDPIPSRRTRPHVPSPTGLPDGGKESNAPVGLMSQHRDPEAARRRELQDRADRIAPSSPDVSAPPTNNGFLPPLPPGTSDASLPFAAPRQPIGAQPTLTSLPGGELPPSWGHPHQSNVAGQGHERQGSQVRGRRHSLSVTMDRMVIGTSGVTPGETGEHGDDQKPESDASTSTFMSADHMKMQPSVWLEKLTVIPMPFGDMRHPENITVHLFDSRSDSKIDRSFLAVHFPSLKMLAVYAVTRVPAADTLRLYPLMNVPALSATSIAAFRGPVCDLLVVKPDNSLVLFTHGMQPVSLQFGPRNSSPSLFGTRPPIVAMDTAQLHGTNLDADDAMAVDDPIPINGDDNNSDTSMNSLIDKEKIVAVSEPFHSAVTVHFADGSTTRAKIVACARDQLTAQCLPALGYALTASRALTLHCSFLAEWKARGTRDADDGEWKSLVAALCGMVDIPSPYHVEGAGQVIPGSWESLSYSASHERLERDVVFKSLDAPFRPQATTIRPPMKKPHEDIVPCLLALHILGESYKLKNDAVHAHLPRLAKLLIALGRAARPEWADHWVRLFPDITEGWADPKRQEDFADSRLRPQPPDIYGYLFTRLVEPNVKPGWTSLVHISQLFHFEPAMQLGRVDPTREMNRLFGIWECFADSTVPTARRRAENALQAMVRLGFNTDELDRLPYGIAQPIREALRTCQSFPGQDWPVPAYLLAHRPDLAQLVSGDANHVPSRDNFRQVGKHYDPSGMRLTVGELLEEAQILMSPDSPPPSGVDLDLGDFTDIRFGSDRRLQEVARMLQSSSAATVRMPERPELTEHEVAREQQTTALRVAERTLALPVGRAMFTFGSVPRVTRDAYQVPKMEFSVILQPYNALVTVEVNKMNVEAKNWADFHNGVATGLRISPSSRMVDSSWITFNKPAELTAQHAGFLFGLGLSGHLKNMMTWHTFSYLTPKHDLTSIGVLLGLSAANLGMANRHVTKLLAVHTPALLPNPSVDLNVPMLTQAAGLVGIGLLYMGTRNRRMAEVALQEIGRTQVTSADQTTDHREAYSQSAALSFGMVMLAAGADHSSPADLNMVSRLRLLIHGEPIVPGNKSSRPSFDVTLTSGPATLALALMFLRTGRQDIADILAVPSTLLELHHLQPSFLLVRTLGRAMIMWDQIAATPQWVTDQLPKTALEALERRMTGKQIDESLELAYFNVVSGACFAMGLKFAGTAQEDPYSCLLHFHDQFTRVSNQNSGQFDHRIKRAAVRDGLNLMSLALAMVMAGTGEINCLRRFRFSHGQAIQPARYGVHMATHMAIGLLFLGGGRYTLGTSDSAIACLLAAFYPRFPTLSHENRGHLQALRHLWVLAVEPRCLMGRDVESREVVYLPVKVKIREGNETRAAQLISPTLFPDINKLLSIRVDTPRYFPFFLDIANNPRHREMLLRSQTLWVKRRTGHLGYGEDPRGSRSIYVRSGASSGDAAVLDNPKASDAKSASATEFYQFISSFSNEAFYVAFVDRFCRCDGDEEDELALSAFSHAAMLECLTLDRPHLLPTYLNIHLTRHVRPGNSPNHTLALRDLTWLDEFYKNIYDARFSGKGDNAPMPPLMRRPLLLAAEHTIDTHLPRLRADPQVQAALRAYHRGEGLEFNAPRSSAERDARVRIVRQLAFYLTRTNVPPGGVLAQMREEALKTHGEVVAAVHAARGLDGVCGEDMAAVEKAVKGLLWNTGVLFAGGILRPWSMRALEECIEDWQT